MKPIVKARVVVAASDIDEDYDSTRLIMIMMVTLAAAIGVITMLIVN